jgi:hypothetical protein
VAGLNQPAFAVRFATFADRFPRAPADRGFRFAEDSICRDGWREAGILRCGGNGEQDTACGVAALQALQELLAQGNHRVLVQADIKM